MGRSILILHSALTPSAVGDVLRREVDEERRTLGSLSGFRGDHAILGDVGQDSFRLRKRRNSRNDFAGQFYARFEPESGGTKIEGFFDSPRWTRYFMLIWLAATAVIGIPIFALTLTNAIAGTRHIDGNRWVGLLVPPGLLLLGIVLPRIGRLLGKGDERFILEFLRNTLAASVEDPTSSRAPARV